MTTIAAATRSGVVVSDAWKAWAVPWNELCSVPGTCSCELRAEIASTA
jgi:hypothetical protein